MAMYGPVWWHHHGIKMRVNTEPSKEKQLVVISSSAAQLSIEPSTKDNLWVVSWKIEHGLSEYTQGVRIVNTEILQVMFRLVVKSYEEGAVNIQLADRFEADMAVQGGFVRQDNFLNIPAPGTGHDGDPNVSLDIRPEMREAISSLIGMR